jgi:hypothetical protein
MPFSLQDWAPQGVSLNYNPQFQALAELLKGLGGQGGMGQGGGGTDSVRPIEPGRIRPDRVGSSLDYRGGIAPGTDLSKLRPGARNMIIAARSGNGNALAALMGGNSSGGRGGSGGISAYPTARHPWNAGPEYNRGGGGGGGGRGVLAGGRGRY